MGQPTLPCFSRCSCSSVHPFRYSSLYSGVTAGHLGALWNWVPPNSCSSLEKQKKNLFRYPWIPCLLFTSNIWCLYYYFFSPFPFCSLGREKCVYHVHIPSSLTLHLLVTDHEIIYFILLHKPLVSHSDVPQPFFLLAVWLFSQYSSRAPTSNFEKFSIPPSVLPTGPFAFPHSIASR